MRSGRLAPWLLTLATAGCYAPPLREEEVAVEHGPEDALLDVDLDEVAIGLGGPVWSERLTLPARPRLTALLVEASVELVESRWSQLGMGGALMFDPVFFLPIRQVLGLGLLRTVYPPSLEDQLPGLFRAALVRALGRHGIEVVARDPRSFAAYGGYLTAPSDTSSPFLGLNPVGGDTGRLRHTRTLSSPELPVVLEARDLADQRLCAEAGVDLVVRARLRLGVVDDRTACETGSRLIVASREETRAAESRRSLLGPAPVVREDDFLPLRGSVLEVDPAAFAGDVARLAPAYVALALER